MSTEHAGYRWDAEPDALVYPGGIVANFPDSGPRADDLLFVMASTNAPPRKHATDPNDLARGKKLRTEGVGIQSAKATHYRSTGRGFLSRWAFG